LTLYIVIVLNMEYYTHANFTSIFKEVQAFVGLEMFELRPGLVFRQVCLKIFAGCKIKAS